MSYFSNFPTITYSNTVVTDVTRRVVIPDSVLRQPTAFSPYTVEGGQRQDTVSYYYYGQDDDDWLISLANQIVDPYYGWFLDTDEFAEFVATKYGSIPVAFQRVHHWVTNWADDNRKISPAYYQALTPNLQKYWIPVYGQGSSILSYSRRQEDWHVATNMLLDVTTGSPVTMEVGDLINVYDSGQNLQGTGELVYASGTDLKVKDITGNWTVGFTVVNGAGTVGTIAATGAPNMLIPIDELVYFESVSCYDYEYDNNEANKEVLIIQDTWKPTMYAEFQASLVSPGV